MKKNFINKLVLGSITLLSMACSSKNEQDNLHEGHRDIPIDTAIQHLAKPTNSHITNPMPTISAKKGIRVFPLEITGRITYDGKNNTSLSSRVTGRIERLWIKYNYQAIRKGQLLFEIYSPDLVTGQRELLMLQQSKQDQLVPAAIQKLQYLGMSANQIQNVLKTNTVLYRIPIYSPTSGYVLESSLTNEDASATLNLPSSSSGDDMSMGSPARAPTAPSSNSRVNTQAILLREGQYVNAGQLLFRIYTNTDLLAEFALSPPIAALVQRGKKVLFYQTDNPNKSYLGQIDLLQPTFNAGKNFSLARVYLNKNPLPVGQLLNATLAVTSKEGFWLPKEAVLSLGNKRVLFRKEAGTFRPIAVQAGITTASEIQILTNIEAWQVAKNASYLVDSEDFIVAAKNE